MPIYAVEVRGEFVEVVSEVYDIDAASEDEATEAAGEAFNADYWGDAAIVETFVLSVTDGDDGDNG